MKLTDLGYIAGMLDGEGNVSISKNKKGSLGWQLYPQVQISNSNLDAILHLRGLLGGCVSTHICLGNRKPSYVLTVPKSSIRALFPRLIPLLYIKRHQVRLMLELLAITRKRINLIHRPPEVRARMLEIYDAMRVANKRGKA